MPLLRTLLLTLLISALSLPTLSRADTPLPDYVVEEFGTPPDIPTGPLSPDLQAAVKTAFIDAAVYGAWGTEQSQAIATIVQEGDPRVVWLIADMMRFVQGRTLNAVLSNAASSLLAKDLNTRNAWGTVTDHLIAWDIPAPPDYLTAKRAIFTEIIPGWENIFVEGDIDWRLVSWGGVLIDARAYNETDEGCDCIPAADNPEVTSAEDATWLSEDTVVFGIEINGEARAYPRSIMEVREMVNDTLGGRDLGIPYCTLCGAAQAYFTDDVPLGVERPILRTSGLLIRSNKVMYDLNTSSVFDTFLGHAVTGPLAEKGVALKQATVVTTDWATWRADHPDTTVLAERYALGRDPDFRNGRDANGPIFPVGNVDPRLPVHEDIVGVITASGKAVAFQRSAAVLALRSGAPVVFENVSLQMDGGGLRAQDTSGGEIPAHQAFWFAWSQFHKGTALWDGKG